MANGFKALVRSPIKGCHVLRKEDIFEKMSLPASMMVEADTSHGLIQAIGYLKYNLAKINYDVVLRGQRMLYGNLRPSLFRKCDNHDDYKIAEENFEKRIQDTQNEFEKMSSAGFMRNTDGALEPLQKNMYKFIDIRKSFFPPLLQHYGISTPWLDVVDNIWVALWFSCWKCEKRFLIPETRNIYPEELNREVARFSMYHERSLTDEKNPLEDEIIQLNHEIYKHEKEKIYLLTKTGIPEDERLKKISKLQERIFQTTNIIDQFKRIPPYCYIILLKVPQNSKKQKEEKIQVVDLRKCIPSYYLRPHAQHAWVIRRALGGDQDFTSSIAGIVRIKLVNALQWLGAGQTLSVKTLFPSPCLDYGLRKLLGLKTFNHEIEIPTP